MANTNAPMGFRLISDEGKSAYRVRRFATGPLFPGDPYTLEDGEVTATPSDGLPSGIAESIEVMEKEGPISYAYLPAGVSGFVIGVEDDDALFEVQCDNLLASEISADTVLGVVHGSGSVVPLHSSYSVKKGGPLGVYVSEIVDRIDNEEGFHAKVVVKLKRGGVVMSAKTEPKSTQKEGGKK